MLYILFCLAIILIHESYYMVGLFYTSFNYLETQNPNIEILLDPLSLESRIFKKSISLRYTIGIYI